MEKILAVLLFVFGTGVTLYVLYMTSLALITNRLQKKLDQKQLQEARSHLLLDPPPKDTVAGENNLFLLRSKPK